MRKRTDTIELFSSFMTFKNGVYSHWVTDNELKTKFSQLYNEKKTHSLQDWEQYFFEQYYNLDNPEENYAYKHIQAYLEETCYSAAQKIKTQYDFLFPDLSIADYCQKIKELEIIKKSILKEDKTNNENASLIVLASYYFPKRLIDFLRTKNPTVGHSDLSLLYHTSETRIKKALIQNGFANVISNYISVWQSFRQEYEAFYTNYKNNVKSVNKLPEPDVKFWNNILNKCQYISTIKTIEYLKNVLFIHIVRAIRNYQSPPDPIKFLYKSETDYLTSILLPEFNNLPPENQEIIKKYFCGDNGEKITQLQLAKDYKKEQSQISRIIKYSINPLINIYFEHLKQEGKINQNTSLDSKLTENFKIQIKSWILTYFS